MIIKHCPRCGKPIPSWQPIHLSCFIYRTRYILFGLATVLVIGVIFGVRIPKFHTPVPISRESSPQATQDKLSLLDTPAINIHITETPSLSPTLKPSSTPSLPLNRTPINRVAITPTTIPDSPTPTVPSFDSSPITRWVTEVVDDEKDVGLLSSMAINDSGISYIAYFDDANDKLRYSFGVTGEWTTQILDNGIRTGFFPSLVLDSHNNPNISYFDRKNKSLKFIRQLGARWEDMTVAENVDISAISLDLTKNDVPFILFFDLNHSDLMLAQYSANRWTIRYVGDGSPESKNINLALDSQGNPHICYYDNGLKYARYNSGAWETEVIEQGSGVGIYSSFVLDENNSPYLSYYNETDHSYEFAYQDGNSWDHQTIDKDGNVGEYNDLVIDSMGSLHTSYYDETNTSLKYANNANGSWETETVDNRSDVGQYTSIALDPFNNPRIGYYDKTNGRLMYASKKVNSPSNTSSEYSTPSADIGTKATPIIGRIDPGQFIRNYYNGINNREYEKTWSMLSDHFKQEHHCCNPDGTYQIEPYIEWWNTVRKIDVISVQEISSNENSANVAIWLRFYYKDGRVVEANYKYGLISNPNSNSWLIDY